MTGRDGGLGELQRSSEEETSEARGGGKSRQSRCFSRCHLWLHFRVVCSSASLFEDLVLLLHFLSHSNILLLLHLQQLW